MLLICTVINANMPALDPVRENSQMVQRYQKTNGNHPQRESGFSPCAYPVPQGNFARCLSLPSIWNEIADLNRHVWKS